MSDTIQSLSKEQIEEVIQLFNPHMDDYLYIMDLKNDYYRISKHAVDRFKLPADSFHDAANNILLFTYKEDHELLNKDFQLILSGQKKSHNLHYRWLNKQGFPIWINCRGRVLDDKDGNPRYLIGCINETGKKQRADNVSGLLGELELSAYINLCADKISSGFLMRIGIDNFSSINATLGIPYGDYIIKHVAGCISDCLKDDQHLFHIVADEYMIVDFDSTSSDTAVLLYRDIQKKISAFIDSENYKSVFTISAGILDASTYSGNYEKLLKLSDFSLKHAKDFGKNSFYIFSKEDYELFIRKRKITRALHHAVSNHFEGFEAYFQPIVDCKTYRLLGAEALMRFSMPSLNGEGMERVSPMEFIPILEETGLILPAGRWILDEAVSMCSEIQQHIPGFRINVNISYVQVMKSSVLKDILSIIERYHLAPEYLGIELTESGYLDNNPHFRSFRNGLKENGIQLILDDFGSGYSNLHCLSDLSPAYIKIDKDFTSKAMLSAYDHELMVKIIEMAHRLNLQICIEGVEETEVLNNVRKIQADYIQGYLFGQPYCKSDFYDKFV